MTLGEKIKNLRKGKNLTQSQLGEITGIAEITIRNYEADKYKPKLDNMQKLSVALDCTVDYLLGNVDSPNFEILTSDMLNEIIEKSNASALQKMKDTIIGNFSKLNTSGKVRLRNYSDDLASLDKYTTKEGEPNAQRNETDE